MVAIASSKPHVEVDFPGGRFGDFDPEWWLTSPFLSVFRTIRLRHERMVFGKQEGECHMLYDGRPYFPPPPEAYDLYCDVYRLAAEKAGFWQLAGNFALSNRQDGSEQWEFVPARRPCDVLIREVQRLVYRIKPLLSNLPHAADRFALVHQAEAKLIDMAVPR
ncbi:MAG TPA: hypothetical protein VJC05_00650 [Candidatus Andersenbacteria bacterium]|nr:hypothetical protein [Candidatus Andersenbacteria bacterium]